MKFINVKTKSTQCEIDEILFNMSMSDVKKVENLYSSFDFVEYTDDNDLECMFCVIDDYHLSKLSKCYKGFSIDFEFVDLTKEVFYDIPFRITYKNQFKKTIVSKVINLISEFKFNYTDVDIVLDKINERGIDSLTDFDKNVLESF
jgi:hypothetical protein